MNGETTKVLYSCAVCGALKRELVVPARGDEDLKRWLDATMALIGTDHAKRSPLCASEKCDLWVPFSGTDRVGGVVRS